VDVNGNPTNTALLAALPVLFIVTVVWRLVTRRQRGGYGPGAAGAYYDMLSKDRREAIQVIVEKRAEKQDPEDKDGNLPELER